MQIETRSLEPNDTATQSHWTACFAVLIAWLVHLFDQIAKLRSHRRHVTKFRPGWQSNYPNLLRCEYLRDQVLAYGAAQLLAGRNIDLTDMPLIMETPAGYGPPCPTDPFAVNRRFLAIAEFQRDPIALILRHAQRIAKREGVDLSNPLLAHGSTGALRAAHHEAVGLATAQLPFTLMVSSDQRERPSNHAGEPRAQARAPPPLRGPPRNPPDSPRIRYPRRVSTCEVAAVCVIL